MFIKRWEDLPENMKNGSVRKYYDLLCKKRVSLMFKRIFDIVVAILILIILLPVFLIISIMIKVDSRGPFMFRQTRITQYGKRFRIFKFRTMVNNADTNGAQLTSMNDTRVTKIGKILRKLRLDELPQLLNIIIGDMSFVGTRPEVSNFVEKYTDEMMATLLLPAGVTSEASILYKDEARIMATFDDETYINKVQPEKMKYNLKSIEDFSFINEIKTMIKTVVAVAKKENEPDATNLKNIIKEPSSIK